MSVFNAIKVIDDLLPPKIIGQLIKFANSEIFEVGLTTGDSNPETVKKVRDTKTCPLFPYSPSLSNAHWANLVHSFFETAFEIYKKDFPHAHYDDISHASILKYEDKGFYAYHVDHGSSIPRTLSCIILLNNDYEGGELCFFDEINKKEHSIQTRPGRLIMWPSNFLFPHTVKPVTKGKRFSVVVWAL
tara:strand:- start:477 stop:1040 length:564 start_codon:yes stop_codon:yes gene_type:complete